jgi:hypothetical protein
MIRLPLVRGVHPPRPDGRQAILEHRPPLVPRPGHSLSPPRRSGTIDTMKPLRFSLRQLLLVAVCMPPLIATWPPAYDYDGRFDGPPGWQINERFWTVVGIGTGALIYFALLKLADKSRRDSEHLE